MNAIILNELAKLVRTLKLWGAGLGLVGVGGIAAIYIRDRMKEKKIDNTKPIHAIGYSSQPDIQFLCDGAWSTPKWGEGEDTTEDEDVFVADDDRHYTFNREKVTCKKCLKKL